MLPPLLCGYSNYLVPDYYEDMKLSSEIWIRDYVDAVPATCGNGQPQAASLDRLQVLYTKHVIPDGVLQLWSNRVRAPKAKVQTILREGEDMEAGKQRINHEWLQFITTHLLQVDSHPTLSRFFYLSGGRGSDVDDVLA